MRRLLLEAHHASAGVELGDAVSLGIGHRIGKYRRIVGARIRALEHRLEIVAIENIVAEHQRRGVAADELAADDECLRQAVRRRLNRVGETDAPARTIAQQRGKAGRVLGVEMSRMSRIPASSSVDSG